VVVVGGAVVAGEAVVDGGVAGVVMDGGMVVEGAVSAGEVGGVVVGRNVEGGVVVVDEGPGLAGAIDLIRVVLGPSLAARSGRVIPTAATAATAPARRAPRRQVRARRRTVIRCWIFSRPSGAGW
jgi:hypothetical protein